MRPSRSSSAPARSTTATAASTSSRRFPSASASTSERVYLACYFPMPFFRSARIELVEAGGGEISGRRAGAFAMRRSAIRRKHVGYFHATYADHPDPELGKDLVLLDTRKAEGGGDWSGQLRRHVVHLLAPRRSEHARRRSAVLLRRQPDAAGPGHRAPRNGAAAAITGAAAR